MNFIITTSWSHYILTTILIYVAKSNPDSKVIMDLVDVVLEGTEFSIVNVKRSPVTKKLLVHIDDKHSKEISLLRPNKVTKKGIFLLI